MPYPRDLHGGTNSVTQSIHKAHMDAFRESTSEPQWEKDLRAAKAAKKAAEKAKKKAEKEAEVETVIPVELKAPVIPVIVEEDLAVSKEKVLTSADRLKSVMGISNIAATNLNICASLPTAPAVAAGLKVSFAADPRKYETYLKNVSGIDNSDDLFNAIEKKDELVSNIGSSVTSDISQTLIKFNFGFDDVLGNIIESVNFSARRVINDILTDTSSITALESAEIIKLLTEGKIDQAVSILVKKSQLDGKTIYEKLSSVETSASSQLNNIQGPKTVLRNTNQNIKAWKESATSNDYKFNYIENSEELEIELKSIKREITEIVFHWTKTANDQNYSAEDLQGAWAEQKGIGIPFHYIIRRDGRLQKARPAEIKTPVIPTITPNGHDNYAIHIAYVGGYNAPAGTKNIQNYEDRLSLTKDQKYIADRFMATFLRAYPGGQILGINDLLADEVCPGLDTREFVELRFGRKSLFTNPLIQPPFSSIQILNTRIPNG